MLGFETNWAQRVNVGVSSPSAIKEKVAHEAHLMATVLLGKLKISDTQKTKELQEFIAPLLQKRVESQHLTPEDGLAIDKFLKEKMGFDEDFIILSRHELLAKIDGRDSFFEPFKR